MTWAAWGVFLLAASIAMLWTEKGLPVNDAYAAGAARWIAREPLYAGGTGFIYLPQSAILYVPFYWMPYALEQVLWRCVTIGAFALGVFRLSRLAQGTSTISYFPLVSLLVLPKTWTCAYSGQATPVMAGLMMIAVAEVNEAKWWRAAALLMGALAFKPLAIVLILLVGFLYPSMRGRLALGFAALFVLPFFFTTPNYVGAQYAAAVTMFDDAIRLGYAPNWPQIFSLAHLVGFETDLTWQTIVRVNFAIITLGVAWCASRRDSTRSGEPAVLPIYALATVYLLLFNPRTENNSYLLLSPVLGVTCARACVTEHRLKASLLAAAALLLVAGHEICQALTPEAGFVWIGPLVCLVFAITYSLAAIASGVGVRSGGGIRPRVLIVRKGDGATC